MDQISRAAGPAAPGQTRPTWSRRFWQRWRGRLGWCATGMVIGLLPTLLPVVFGAEDGMEPGELVVMMDKDQSVGEQRIRLIREWERLQDDLPEDRRIRVRIIQVPTSATAARSQMVAHAQAGGGDVDIYSLDVTWVAEFAQQRWLRPLDRSAINERAFLEKPLDAGRYDGELWALPFNTDAPLLYYRKDLVESPPRNWLEILEAWQSVREAEESLEAGYAGQFADYEGLTVNVLEALLAEDPQALAGSGWADDPELWRAALARLAERFTLDQGLFLPDSLGHTESGSLEAFRAKQVLFMRNWPVALRRLTEIDAEEVPVGQQWVRSEHVGVTNLPSPSPDQDGVGVLGGQSLAIAADTDQPRAAQRLIEFLTSPRSQEKLFVDGGFVPTQQVVYDDLIEEYDYLRTVRTAVELAQLRPVHPRYELISEAIRRVVRPYLVTAASPDPPLTDPSALARQLIDELADARDGYRR